MFEDILQEYMRREPPGSDTWNPLKNELELWHRIRLFHVMAWAFNQIPMPMEEIKILDVGCGVGRSTRALLDFGAKPQNLTGIDLRPHAIAYARSINPAISFQVVQDFEGWPQEKSFYLCMQCTVFGSIRGVERRLALAEKMESMVMDGGYIFWWNAIHANSFAGGDLLEPSKLFRNCETLGVQLVSLQPSVIESIHSKNFWIRRVAKFLQIYAGYQPTHQATLLKLKKSS